MKSIYIIIIFAVIMLSASALRDEFMSTAHIVKNGLALVLLVAGVFLLIRDYRKKYK